MIKQLKVNQKVLLICQEVIGTVVDVNNELDKVVIRAEKNGTTFDFVVTTSGCLPFSETEMIEEIPFIEGETVVFTDSTNTSFRIGVINNISITQTKELVGTFTDKSINKVVSLKECEKITVLYDICEESVERNANMYIELYKDSYLPGNNGGQTTQGEEE